MDGKCSLFLLFSFYVKYYAERGEKIRFIAVIFLGIEYFTEEKMVLFFFYKSKNNTQKTSNRKCNVSFYCNWIHFTKTLKK